MFVGLEDVDGNAGTGVATSVFSPLDGCCEDRLDGPVAGDGGEATAGEGVRVGLH